MSLSSIPDANTIGPSSSRYRVVNNDDTGERLTWQAVNPVHVQRQFLSWYSFFLLPLSRSVLPIYNSWIDLDLVIISIFGNHNAIRFLIREKKLSTYIEPLCLGGPRRSWIVTTPTIPITCQ
jgi:hypothetical protein